MPTDTGILAPSQDGHAGQFRSVVAHDGLGIVLCASMMADSSRVTRMPRQRCVGDQAKAFATEVVDDGQHAEADGHP